MPQDSIKHRLPAAALTFALPTPPVRRANSLSQPVRALLIPSVRRAQLGSSKARRPRAACASEPPLSPVRLDLSRTDYSNLTVGWSRSTESRNHLCVYPCGCPMFIARTLDAFRQNTLGSSKQQAVPQRVSNGLPQPIRSAGRLC